MAVSLTEMLLEHGGKAKFLEFGRAASREGTQRALERHYDIREVTQLQSQWQSWVATRTTAPSVQLSQNTGEPGLLRFR